MCNIFRLCVIVGTAISSAACGPDDLIGEMSSVSVGPADADRIRPGHRECQEDCVTRHVWSHDGALPYGDDDDVFDFDEFSRFGVNLVDPSAFTLLIPGVQPGDDLRVSASGLAYSDHDDADVSCLLQAHVTDSASGEEVPVELGGHVQFPLSASLQTDISLLGFHTVGAPGRARVRILGRVSRPDRFCGFAGKTELAVTHTRRTK
jgi:hypothetical protein